MFGYQPTVNDNSGQIIAGGMMGAADTQANMMAGLGQNIGGALQSIGAMYGEVEGRKAKGRAFKDVFKVVAPSAGIDMKQLEQLNGGSLKNDMDWANASEIFSPLLPSLINARLVSGKMGIQQQAPFVGAGLQGLRDRASGNQTFIGGSTDSPANVAPVEPPLPPMSQAGPVDKPATVSATPAASMPGGESSREKLNRDRAKRGLPPI